MDLTIEKLNSCHIKVINLDSRPDRWANVQEELKKLSLTNYVRFPGIVYSPNEGGAWMGSVVSHFKCVTEGEDGMLLVFEDDVSFEDNILEILPKALSQLPDDFDLFYIGANVKASATRHSENLFRVMEGVHTNHAILFSNKARETIKANYDPFHTEYCTFDHWLYVVGQNLMKCYVCYPLVAFQKGGMSDVRQEELDDIYREEMLNNQKLHMQ